MFTVKIKKSLKTFLFFLLFFTVNFMASAGAMAVPRRIYLLKTDHFDILFSEPSSDTAKMLADNIEGLYDKAFSNLDGAHDLRIPVIISPDSDKLSVQYTCSPYNRIVIFDGVPESKDMVFQDSLLGLFYHEIYLALSQSIRNPFNQFISKTIGGDGYQPVSLFYLPFSFVEGRAYLAEGTNLFADSVEESTEADTEISDATEISDDDLKEFTGNYGHFNDKEFLEILSIAKYENKFPNWLQAGSVRDIYPGKLLNDAAGTAFSAYLMNTYGIDKYIEFWEQCGGVNLALTSEMFKKVYGISLNQLWSDFKNSVPLPDDLAEMKELEEKTDLVIPGDREGVSSCLLSSEYGLIWYDDIRHEVDIYDWNSQIKMRKLLFLASDVKNLTLSPDGRFLVVSFCGIKNSSQFRDDKVWIFDLQEREFLDYDFRLRDGVIVKNNSEKDYIAGINIKDKVSKIQIYNFDYDDEFELVYEKDFPKNEYPDNLTFAGKGKINYVLSKNNKTTLNQYDFENDKEVSWQILFKGEPVKIKNLRLIKAEKTEIKELKNENLYSFEYYLSGENSYSRMGLILLDENFNPEEVYFQRNNFAGGVRYPVIYDSNLYFCAQKVTHNELHYMPVNEVIFESGTLEQTVVEKRNIEEPFKIENKILSDYELANYNPLKYMIHCSFVPFMALKDLASTEEQGLWPSLGGTFITQYDPFMNNRIMLSGSYGYAKLDFKTLFNPTKDDLNEEKENVVDDNKNISFGVSLENSSTPVNVRAGCIFKFNENGEYNFNVSANTLWQIPIGMAFSKINFSILSNYIASTDYYDSNLSDHYPGKSNWPKFTDAYELGKVTVGVEYSNIHQSGISKFEQRGFSLGAKLDSFWDITEIRLLNDKYNILGESLKKGETGGLTQAQIDIFYDENMLQLSQLMLGIYGEIKIPRLTPLNMFNGLVLSVPATIKAELFNETGTALHASAEALLLGYECQNGIPFLYLFFSRFGLKFGYDMRLNYDTYKVPLPDIRVKDNLWNVFDNSYLHDSIYLIYDMDFCASVGRLSEYQLSMEMKTEYFLQSKGFAFSLNFLVSF